ncbi:MAG: inositol monophosphatase [Clostridia bacterium]|nr:inositol monophosphatase [Clostridia bacterium]
MLQQVCAAVKAAGEIILSAHYSGDGMTKSGDRNYVTEYDVRVQNTLQKALAEIAPDVSFCGEESDAQTVGKKMWIVDPIDGTSNFIHDLRSSAISVALADSEENAVELAVIYNPYFDEMFAAERGKGATCNGVPIHVSDHDYPHALIGFGTTPYDRALAHATFEMVEAAYIESLDMRRSGSAAIDLAHIAMGRIDGFFEFRLQPWDYAAGALLITEAGGIISRFDGQPLDLLRPSSVLTGNPQVYADLMRTAEPYRTLVY